MFLDVAILAFIGVGGYIYYLKKQPGGDGLVDNEAPSAPNTKKTLPDVASSQEEVMQAGSK